MARASQPFADACVTRAHNEEGDSGNNECGIEHGALLIENANVFMRA
jgi:hypothetical protein